MLLAVDVGNTNVVMGLYRGAELTQHWRLATDARRTADEYAALLRGVMELSGRGLADIDGMVVGSVVPALTPMFGDVGSRYLGVTPLVVGPGMRTGVDLRYENPREIGADRIVNAVAAHARYGGPVIVVDFGTATTFDVISADGAYLGGAIAPGIGIATDALFERAARLSRVDIVRPARVIGKTTVTAIQSGVYFGFLGQVDELVRRILGELGQPARVVATGGLADLLVGDSTTIAVVDPWLTLEGLRIVWERNLPAD